MLRRWCARNASSRAESTVCRASAARARCNRVTFALQVIDSRAHFAPRTRLPADAPARVSIGLVVRLPCAVKVTVWRADAFGAAGDIDVLRLGFLHPHTIPSRLLCQGDKALVG